MASDRGSHLPADLLVTYHKHKRDTSFVVNWIEKISNTDFGDSATLRDIQDASTIIAERGILLPGRMRRTFKRMLRSRRQLTEWYIQEETTAEVSSTSAATEDQSVSMETKSHQHFNQAMAEILTLLSGEAAQVPGTGEDGDKEEEDDEDEEVDTLADDIAALHLDAGGADTPSAEPVQGTSLADDPLKISRRAERDAAFHALNQRTSVAIMWWAQAREGVIPIAVAGGLSFFLIMNLLDPMRRPSDDVGLPRNPPPSFTDEASLMATKYERTPEGAAIRDLSEAECARAPFFVGFTEWRCLARVFELLTKGFKEFTTSPQTSANSLHELFVHRYRFDASTTHSPESTKVAAEELGEEIRAARIILNRCVSDMPTRRQLEELIAADSDFVRPARRLELQILHSLATWNPNPVSLWCLQVMIETCKAYAKEDQPDLMVQVRMFAMEIRDEIRKSECQPVKRGRQLLMNDLEKLSKFPSLNLFSRSPLVAGSIVYMVARRTLGYGLTFLNSNRIFGTVLWCYHVAKIVLGGSRRIPFLDKICEMFEGCVFLDELPTARFYTTWLRFIGVRISQRRGKTVWTIDDETPRIAFDKVSRLGSMAGVRAWLCLVHEKYNKNRPPDQASQRRFVREMKGRPYGEALQRLRELMMDEFDGDLPITRINWFRVLALACTTCSKLEVEPRLKKLNTSFADPKWNGMLDAMRKRFGIAAHFLRFQDKLREPKVRTSRGVPAAEAVMEIFEGVWGNRSASDFFWKHLP